MLKVTVDSTKVEAWLDEMPASVMAALETKVHALAINLQAHIVRDKLSGQVLHQRSGALARSIQEVVTTSGSMVTGEVFSAGDVKYARIHEFGGDIYPVKAKALSFVIDGKRIFTQHVHIPERSYMRSSLADQAAEIVAGLKLAALQGMRGGITRET